jgi:hypothetical protein
MNYRAASAAKVRQMAQDFRARANETEVSSYRRQMLATAMELDEIAAFSDLLAEGAIGDEFAASAHA